jgi:putative oxidoreductase
MSMVDIGLLILRVVLGLVLVGHGSQKLFGWFGGPGLQGVAGWFGASGLRPAPFWAFMAGIAEFGGGLLLAVGLLNPLGAIGITASMFMAIVMVHWPRFWNTEGGLEFPLVNMAAAIGLALTGPGLYSLDAYFGIGLAMPITLYIGLVAVLVGSAIAMGTRAQPVQQAPAAAVPSEEVEERRAA